MPAITSLDLSNAKLDVDHIAAIATSLQPTATDRLGHTKLTMQGAVDTIKAFNPRGARVNGAVYTLKDLYTEAGITYITVVSSFTSVSVSSDIASGNVTIYQGLVFSDLSNKDGAKLIGSNGTNVQDLLSGLVMQKAIKTSPTEPLSICPRVAAAGSMGFSVGIFLNVSTFANSPGIIGGLVGGLTLRLNTDGTIKVSKTAVADIYTTTAAADTNRNMLVLFSRDDSGHNEISVNGISFGTFEDSTSFTSDFFYVGTTDGLNSYISAEIGYVFISRSFISTTDAIRIINNGGLEYSDAKACWLASGDTHLGSSLVVPSLRGTGENANLTPSTLVLPVSASIKNYKNNPNIFTNTSNVGPAYIIGDSQSKQFNASGSLVYTDTATNILKDEYKWTFKYAKQNNRDLQINNYAVTGSGLNYTPGQAYTTVSPAWNPHLYQMGNIIPEWTGQIIIIPGWNNIPDIVNDTTAKAFRRSIEALIARAYCRYSGALGVGGFYGNNYGSGGSIQGFSTTGTNGDVTQDIYGTSVSSVSNPFKSFGAPTNNLIRKINLAPTQYVEWDVLQVDINGRYGVIVEANTAGSSYTVSVAGTVVITDSSVTPLQGNWPQVNWIENAPQGQKMRVTNTGSGNVLFLAVVFEGADVVVSLDRSIILCTTTGNPTGRTRQHIQTASKLAEAAVSTFGDLGVKFCNLSAGWQEGDNDAQDPPHISPQGTDRIATRLMNVESVTHFLPSWCYSF